MDITTTILLIIIPYVLYKIILYYLEEKQDLEISKMMKSMIFVIADILIMVIANAIGK